MDGPRTIFDAVAGLASGLPGDVLDRVAHAISTSTPAEARRRVADAVHHPYHRSLATGFVDDWQSMGVDASAAEVAMAIRMAAHVERRRGERQSAELVWTGPRCKAISHRYTEQAVLQVLNSARSRLLLVSYAVYSIPNIQDAVMRAARRGVRIEVVVETPDRLEGHGTYSTLQALGEEVAACSTVYLWPKEMRGRSDEGKLGILHVKCVVADGRWLYLSSANLTEYAFTINMELGLLVTGGHLPTQVEGLFDRIIRDGILVKV